MAGEAKIEAYLKLCVQKAKGEIRKLRFLGRRGAPDRLVWIPNWLFSKLVELKDAGKPLQDHQVREHKRLRKMGFEVYKIDSKEDVDKLLRSRK